MSTSINLEDPLIKWLILELNKGVGKRAEWFTAGLRSYSLVQSLIYLKGLGHMAEAKQEEKIGESFLSHCGITVRAFKNVLPESITEALVRSKNKKGAPPTNASVLSDAKLAKAAVLNSVLPAYKAELTKRGKVTLPSGMVMTDILENVTNKLWDEQERKRLKERKKNQLKKKVAREIKTEPYSTNEEEEKEEENDGEDLDDDGDDTSFTLPDPSFVTPKQDDRDLMKPKPIGWVAASLWTFILLGEISSDPSAMLMEAADPVKFSLKVPIVLGPGETSSAGVGRDRKKQIENENKRIRANVSIRARNQERQERRDQGCGDVDEDEKELEDDTPGAKKARILESIQANSTKSSASIAQIAATVKRSHAIESLEKIYALVPTEENKNALLAALGAPL